MSSEKIFSLRHCPRTSLFSREEVREIKETRLSNRELTKSYAALR